MNEISPKPVSGMSGPATDRNNEPVVDPTQNVRELVDAAIMRQDDLRATDRDHLQQLMTLRANHAKELRMLETARIDAIRAVDVGAVNRAAEVAATQATTLATQVAVSAETLRAQVAAAASASTIALAAALEPVQGAIADLRRAQYEQQGQRAQVQEGRSAGSATGMWIGVAVAALGLIISALVVLLTVLR